MLAGLIDKPRVKGVKIIHLFLKCRCKVDCIFRRDTMLPHVFSSPFGCPASDTSHCNVASLEKSLDLFPAIIGNWPLSLESQYLSKSKRGSNETCLTLVAFV